MGPFLNSVKDLFRWNLPNKFLRYFSISSLIFAKQQIPCTPSPDRKADRLTWQRHEYLSWPGKSTFLFLRLMFYFLFQMRKFYSDFSSSFSLIFKNQRSLPCLLGELKPYETKTPCHWWRVWYLTSKRNKEITKQNVSVIENV